MISTNIIKKSIKNDKSSQKAIFDAFYGKLFVVVNKYVENNKKCNDILLEGFKEVFCKMSQYDCGESFEKWLRNSIINYVLKCLMKEKINFDELKSDFSATINDAELFLKIQHTEPTEILKIIQKLPIQNRIIFNMFSIDGYSQNEILEKLNISEDVLKINLELAKENIKKELIKK